MTRTVETLERRCPRLGDQIRFGYCRDVGNHGAPCDKVFDCWWEIFDVVGYLRRRLSEAEFLRLAATRPAPKILGILERVEKARRGGGPGTGNDSNP